MFGPRAVKNLFFFLLQKDLFSSRGRKVFWVTILCDYRVFCSLNIQYWKRTWTQVTKHSNIIIDRILHRISRFILYIKKIGFNLRWHYQILRITLKSCLSVVTLYCMSNISCHFLHRKHNTKIENNDLLKRAQLELRSKVRSYHCPYK